MGRGIEVCKKAFWGWEAFLFFIGVAFLASS